MNWSLKLLGLLEPPVAVSMQQSKPRSAATQHTRISRRDSAGRRRGGGVRAMVKRGCSDMAQCRPPFFFEKKVQPAPMKLTGVLSVLLATSIGCGLAFQTPCIRSRVPIHLAVNPRCCARRFTIRCVLRRPLDSVIYSVYMAYRPAGSAQGSNTHGGDAALSLIMIRGMES